MIKAEEIRYYDCVSVYSYGVGDTRNNDRHGNVLVAELVSGRLVHDISLISKTVN